VADRYEFLLVCSPGAWHWRKALQEVLASMGTLDEATENEALAQIVERDYDMIIIDAGRVGDDVRLTRQLRARRPGARIVVATDSPTWQRARSAFEAGAADYITKSLDRAALRSDLEAVLEVPAPPPSP